jgi:CBS-domain-containing membrane protein
MTHDVQTATPETPLSEVVRIMERPHIKRLPVIEDGKMVGIVTRANLLHAMASFVDEVAAPHPEDTAIREQLLAELATQPWAPVATIDVSSDLSISSHRGILQPAGLHHSSQFTC